MNSVDDSTRDARAVEAVRAGDLERFRELVDRHQRRVFGAMARMTGRRADAEDLTQQAFLEAYAGLAAYDTKRPFGTWILRIATNNCLDHLKSHKRREVPTEVESDGGGALHAGHIPGPEQELARKQRVAQLEVALQQLDDIYRIPLVLKDIEGLAYQEIQQVLDLPLTTLKMRVVRAREQLKKLVGLAHA